MRRNWLVGLFAVLSLVGAACGDDDDGNAAQQTDDNEKVDNGVTADTIKVSLVIAKTGSAATAHADFDKGFEAYIEMINDDGGVNGRKIEVVGVSDDTGDANRNKAEIQAAVEQDKVFTVLGCFPQFGAVDFINTTKLPLIGCNHDAPTWEKTEYALGITGNWLDKTP